MNEEDTMAAKPDDRPEPGRAGYYFWETELLDDTEAEAREVAALVLYQTVRTLAFPIYGIPRLEHALQGCMRKIGGPVDLVDEYRESLIDATCRLALEVAPLLAPREGEILSAIEANDRAAITAIFGEMLAGALAGTDRWYPQGERERGFELTLRTNALLDAVAS